ncbi:MAG TPA: TVP38/TMEM64 family protein [Candidatus Binataceae bacterium]|nr:TVP38/TMEM64 family protein [Candidatus Binataceae bacterium]
MAAIKPIGAEERKNPQGSNSLAGDALKLGIILAMVAIAGYLLWAHREWFDDPQLIKAEVLQLGIWGPIGFMLLFAIGPSLLVPGAVMTIAGGLAFGTWWGALYSIIGADVGALVAFALGRALGKGFVERLVPARFEHLLDKVARNGFHIILYLRFFPIIPYNALNLLAGASPITFRDYFWASMIGMIPGTILFAFLGNAMWHPTSPRFFVALVLIALCFAGGEIYRRSRPNQVPEL